VINSMLQSFQMPTDEEGFSTIKVIEAWPFSENNSCINSVLCL
jgi:hypothetical protein